MGFVAHGTIYLSTKFEVSISTHWPLRRYERRYKRRISPVWTYPTSI